MSPTAAVVDIYSKVWGPCLMLDTYLYNTFFGALTRTQHHQHHQTAHAAAAAVSPSPTAGLPAADMSDAGMGVKFVRAQCDKILELSEYRENACPHFLFYMVCAHAILSLRRCASGSAGPAHATDSARAPAFVRMARRSSTSRGLRSLT